MEMLLVVFLIAVSTNVAVCLFYCRWNFKMVNIFFCFLLRLEFGAAISHRWYIFLRLLYYLLSYMQSFTCKLFVYI